MVPKSPKIINPLWIISLFLSFTEIVLGYAVSNTTGEIQVALTAFVILFPLLIGIGFFALLWYRPEHLYAPKDYESDESFLRSIANAKKAREGLLTLDSEIELRINKILTSEPTVQKLSIVKGEELLKTLKDTAVNISNEIREANFFIVSLAHFSGDPNDKLTFPVNAFANFNDLTDEIYYAAKGLFEPFTYGTSWVLRDKASGKIFKHARMISGIGPGKPLKDDRTLEEMGIKAGMVLEVVPSSEH